MKAHAIARPCAHRKQETLKMAGGFPDDHTMTATRCLRCGTGFITVEWATRADDGAVETRTMTMGEQRRYLGEL